MLEAGSKRVFGEISLLSGSYSSPRRGKEANQYNLSRWVQSKGRQDSFPFLLALWPGAVLCVITDHHRLDNDVGQLCHGRGAHYRSQQEIFAHLQNTHSTSIAAP